MPIDFKVSNDFDLVVDKENYLFDEEKKGALITGFFTDARINNQRGYWIEELISSGLWPYYQSRLTNQILNEVIEVFTNTSNRMVDDGLFDDIEVFGEIENNTIVIRCVCKSGSKEQTEEFEINGIAGV